MALKMRFYRHTPGDLGLADEPILGEIPPSTHVLKSALFARHMLPDEDDCRPMQGEIVNSEGEVFDWTEFREALAA